MGNVPTRLSRERWLEITVRTIGKLRSDGEIPGMEEPVSAPIWRRFRVDPQARSVNLKHFVAATTLARIQAEVELILAVQGSGPELRISETIIPW
jgi:hypothetical protein